MKNKYRRFSFAGVLKGVAMGIAEVIPGVSGGTIAFITGIYEELMRNIAEIDFNLIRLIAKFDVKGISTKFNFPFIFSVGFGMILGIVVGVFGVTWVSENFPILLTAFFFGLILSSARYIIKKIPRIKWMHIVMLIVSTVISYYITTAVPANGSDSLVMIFIAGAIAVSALLLPGVSGSMMLLLMGMYYIIIPNVKGFLEAPSLKTSIVIITFAGGMLVGMITFAKVIKWAFEKHFNYTMAILSGLMIGSLNKIWPWQNVLQTRINSKGIEVPLYTESVMPDSFLHGDPQVLFAVFSMSIGFIIVFVLERYENE